jgi:predicted Rossmann fold flavoprotein
VGAGAAGLAAAIFARRSNPSRSVVILEGQRTPGAKILVSGGSRCNVTNVAVTERDFWGGRPSIVRRILRAFPAEAAVEFFRELRIGLHEEDDGKLFPDSNRSRDVLNALLTEAARVDAEVRSNHRVTAVEKDAGGFAIWTPAHRLRAQKLVLATGGQSLPKSGSDGAGYEFARALGHTLVPTTPALVPLVMGEEEPLHRRLAGVSQPVELTLRAEGRVATRISGPLLWTHFGISGPAALNASRHWLRAEIEGRRPSITSNFQPGETFETVDAAWQRLATERPRLSLQHALKAMVPARFATTLLEAIGIAPDLTLAHLSRDARRAVVHALVAWPLPVIGSRGYTFAEATAGGVPLSEIDPATMASRRSAGLYLVGEILDVDGRLGGFNFQWAWSTAYVAGCALGR